VLARALEKDPQRRTATVNRLRDEFKAAVRGRALGAEQAHEIPESAFYDQRPPRAGSGVYEEDFARRAGAADEAGRRAE
jgi:hypothetical protein